MRRECGHDEICDVCGYSVCHPLGYRTSKHPQCKRIAQHRARQNLKRIRRRLHELGEQRRAEADAEHDASDPWD